MNEVKVAWGDISQDFQAVKSWALTLNHTKYQLLTTRIGEVTNRCLLDSSPAGDSGVIVLFELQLPGQSQPVSNENKSIDQALLQNNMQVKDVLAVLQSVSQSPTRVLRAFLSPILPQERKLDGDLTASNGNGGYAARQLHQNAPQCFVKVHFCFVAHVGRL